MNNPIAIVQARMGSTRLPGKVLKPLVERPALWHVVDRLKHAKLLNDVVIATTMNREDDIIIHFCEENHIKYFRGSENDVLDRYYQAAQFFRADPVIRITADCPVVDPLIVDEVVNGFFQGGYDVYGLGGEFPDGLDCECFTFSAIEDAWRNSDLPSEREHVGVYMARHPEKYKSGAYLKFQGLTHHRWTLDEPVDLQFLEALYERLYQSDRIFLTDDILDLLDKEPDFMKINSHIVRNEGLLKSLREDEKYMSEKKLG